MSIDLSKEEAMKTIKSQNEYIVQLSKEKCALQAKIDSLMLEFCPEEMTQEQLGRWEESQVVSIHLDKDTISEALKQEIFEYYKRTDYNLGK